MVVMECLFLPSAFLSSLTVLIYFKTVHAFALQTKVEVSVVASLRKSCITPSGHEKLATFIAHRSIKDMLYICAIE